jgi:uncharacterized OB-fold protein
MGMALCVDDVPEATIHPMPSFSEFWKFLRRRKLAIRKCSKCNILFSPARVSCPRCLSTDLEWSVSKGAGEVYSYSTVYVAFDDELNEVYCKNKLPYTFALVKLEEGILMSSDIIGCDPCTVHIGMKVKIAFDAVNLSKEIPSLSKLRLPPFKPLS